MLVDCLSGTNYILNLFWGIVLNWNSDFFGMVLHLAIFLVWSNDHLICNCVRQLFLNTIMLAFAIFGHSSEGCDSNYCSVWQVNIFINDIPKINSLPEIITSITIYAGDVQLLFSGSPNNLEQLKIYTETRLKTMKEWYSENGLKMNSSKTRCVLLQHQILINGLR